MSTSSISIVAARRMERAATSMRYDQPLAQSEGATSIMAWPYEVV